MLAGHDEVNKGPPEWGPGQWGRNPYFFLSPGVLEGRRANGGEAERDGDGQGLASSAVGGAVKTPQCNCPIGHGQEADPLALVDAERLTTQPRERRTCKR